MRADVCFQLRENDDINKILSFALHLTKKGHMVLPLLTHKNKTASQQMTFTVGDNGLSMKGMFISTRFLHVCFLECHLTAKLDAI